MRGGGSTIAGRFRLRPVGAIAGPLSVHVANIGLGIPTGIIAARFLGPLARGELATFSAGAFLLSTAVAACTHESLPFLKRAGRDPSRVIGTVLALQLGLGLVAAAISFGIPSLPALPADTIAAVRGTQPFFAVACVAFAANHALSWGVLIQSGATSYVRIETVRQSAYLIALTVLVVMLGRHLEGALAAYVIGLAVQVSTGGALLRRTTRTLAWESGIAREELRFGLRALPGRLAEYFFIGRGDALVFSLAVGSAGVGYYVVARVVSDLTLLPGLSAGLVVQQSDPSAVPLRTRHLLFVAAALTLAGAAVLALVGPQLIRLVFGDAFTPSGDLLRLLLLAVPALLVNRVVAAWNTRSGYPHRNSVAIGASAAVFVVSAILAGRAAGTAAAVAAFVGSAWLQTAILGVLHRLGRVT